MNYFIAFSGRTGSSWLCDLLSSTGCLGRPLEHFCIDERDRLIPNPTWNSATWTTHYAEYLRHTASDNGVTAAKVTWRQWSRLRVGLGHEPDVQAWVWLRRRDKLRQAISSYKNERNRQSVLRAGDTLLPDPPCDEARILVLALSFEDEDVLWTSFFARRSYLELWYEELVVDPRLAVQQVADHLAIELPSVRRSSAHRPMANATSGQWYEHLRPRWDRLRG
jgi:trehalose 2-sulfotransferase